MGKESYSTQGRWGKKLPLCRICHRRKYPKKSKSHDRKCKGCGKRYCAFPIKQTYCSKECASLNRPTCMLCGKYVNKNGAKNHGRKCRQCGKFFCDPSPTNTLCKRHRRPGTGKSGYRKDLGIFVRSSWEANFARVLSFKGVRWKYESKSFSLGGRKRYIPDFQLGKNKYVEVKGYASPKWEKKLKKFKARYPEVDLKVLGPQDYEKLRGKYQDQVRCWEN